ncbi:MAG: ribosome maturation factor RimM [Candidatus Margulisbacteria bacterium]|nr:ribosome maturation factor RimM [Candidatus Margulisiibacteriota bacterium]
MYLLGVIVGAHGVKGELKLRCRYSNFAFSKISKIFIGGQKYTPLAARPHKTNILLKLSEITSLSAAEKLRGQKAESAVKPSGDAVLYEDVWQKKVYDQNGQFIGMAAEIIQSPAHDILVVRKNKKEILIPLIPIFVKEISDIIKVDLKNLEEYSA